MPARPLKRLVGAALALGVVACAPAEEPRVVSLSPAASELVVALEAGALLVAVDAESSRLEGLEGLPVATAATAAEHDPDLVLVSRLAAGGARLRERGVVVVELAPHDFDAVADLCRALGARLGRVAQARAYVRDEFRPLAVMSASSRGRPRPRIAAVVGLDPLEVAGHGFVGDLVEIAGAENVTHGVEARSVRLTAAELAATSPDLVLVVTRREPGPAERRAAEASLPAGTPVAFLAFDVERFWVRGSLPVARRLRALVEPLADAAQAARVRE